VTPAALARLHAAAFTTPRPWSEAEIADLLASPFCFLLTEPGGFLIGRAVAGEAELLTVAVESAARRQGIGARLMAAFLTEARARGAESVFLEVAADNHAARALYAAAGFQPAGIRRGYYRGPVGQPVDALLLRRGL
jgi:ribosomal-protein-alanine N-acetyltransferase